MEKEINNIINGYLNETSDKANKYLQDKLNGKTVLGDHVILKQELGKKIRELLDNVNTEVKDTPKYNLLNLFNILNKNEYKLGVGNDEIIEDVNNTRMAISKLSESEYKNNIGKELNAILNKHKDIISEALNNVVTKEDYEKIVLELRKEIHPILEKIAKYVKLDEYEKLGKNIYRQLEISFELADEKRSLDDELKEYKNNDILLEVINIMREIEEKQIDEETKKKINNDLKNVLTAIKSLLEVSGMEKSEEYIRFMGASMALFGDVSRNIERYMKAVGTYNTSFGVNLKK